VVLVVVPVCQDLLHHLGPTVQRHVEVQHRRHEVHSLDQPSQVGTLERADLHKQVVAAFSIRVHSMLSKLSDHTRWVRAWDSVNEHHSRETSAYCHYEGNNPVLYHGNRIQHTRHSSSYAPALITQINTRWNQPQSVTVCIDLVNGHDQRGLGLASQANNLQGLRHYTVISGHLCTT